MAPLSSGLVAACSVALVESPEIANGRDLREKRRRRMPGIKEQGEVERREREWNCSHEIRGGGREGGKERARDKEEDGEERKREREREDKGVKREGEQEGLSANGWGPRNTRKMHT